MSLRLRRARPDDAAGLMAVKAALPLRDAGRGGFLLGSSEAGYRGLVAAAHVLVLERSNRVEGFAVALPDGVLRASPLWARRAAIRFDALDPLTLETARLGYFDQLAVLPEPRLARWAPVLGFAALSALLEDGCEHVFATTLVQPSRNDAALSLLQALGARPAGEVEEIYDGVGPVLSAVHHLDLTNPGVVERLRGHPLALRLIEAAGRLGLPTPQPTPAG
jgi:hypothetical protein